MKCNCGKIDIKYSKEKKSYGCAIGPYPTHWDRVCSHNKMEPFFFHHKAGSAMLNTCATLVSDHLEVA